MLRSHFHSGFRASDVEQLKLESHIDQFLPLDCREFGRKYVRDYIPVVRNSVGEGDILSLGRQAADDSRRRAGKTIFGYLFLEINPFLLGIHLQVDDVVGSKLVLVGIEFINVAADG